MNSDINTLEEFAERLRRFWGGLAVGTAKLPSHVRLVELLNLAFWASMEVEEGRSLRFSIAIVEDDAGSRHGSNYVPLVQSRRATVQEIRRLAPATDPHTTLIAITGNSDVRSGVVGLIRVHALNSSLDDVVPETVIRVDGPGRLYVQSGPRRIASFDRGRILLHELKSGLEVFDGMIPIVDWVQETFVAWPHKAYEPTDTSYGSVYMSALVSTLARIDELGHGGALILTPKGADLSKLGLVGRYDFGQRGTMLRDAVFDAERALVTYENSLKRHESDSRIAYTYRTSMDRVTHAARFIGELTGSDGAVVLTTDLQVLGAGVQLPSELSTPTIDYVDVRELRRAQHHDESVFHPHVVDEVGMRHRSSFAFVHGQEGAVAIVISQDGGMSVVCRPTFPSGSPDGSTGYRSLDRVVVVKGVRIWNPLRVDGV